MAKVADKNSRAKKRNWKGILRSWFERHRVFTALVGWGIGLTTFVTHELWREHLIETRDTIQATQTLFAMRQDISGLRTYLMAIRAQLEVVMHATTLPLILDRGMRDPRVRLAIESKQAYLDILERNLMLVEPVIAALPMEIREETSLAFLSLNNEIRRFAVDAKKLELIAPKQGFPRPYARLSDELDAAAYSSLFPHITDFVAQTLGKAEDVQANNERWLRILTVLGAMLAFMVGAVAFAGKISGVDIETAG